MKNIRSSYKINQIINKNEIKYLIKVLLISLSASDEFLFCMSIHWFVFLVRKMNDKLLSFSFS
jgi:hypothetical protein